MADREKGGSFRSRSEDDGTRGAGSRAERGTWGKGVIRPASGWPCNPIMQGRANPYCDYNPNKPRFGFPPKDFPLRPGESSTRGPWGAEQSNVLGASTDEHRSLVDRPGAS